MNPEDLSGVRKAAILLLTMDDEVTKDVMKGLDEEEIEAIGKEITNLKLIPTLLSTGSRKSSCRRCRRREECRCGESKFRLLVRKASTRTGPSMLLGNLDTKRCVPESS